MAMVGILRPQRLFKILHAFRTHVIQPVELAGMIYLICVIALSLCIVWFKHIQYTNGIQKKAFRLMHANLYPIIYIYIYIYMCVNFVKTLCEYNYLTLLTYFVVRKIVWTETNQTAPT